MSELIMKFSGPDTALSYANKLSEHNRQIMPVSIIDAEVKFTVKYPNGVIKTHKIIMEGNCGSAVGVSRVYNEYDGLEDVGIKFDGIRVRKQYEILNHDKSDEEMRSDNAEHSKT